MVPPPPPECPHRWNLQRGYLRNCTPTPKGASQDSTWMTMEATNWLGSNEKLFALVAEVAAKLHEKQ